MSIIPNPAHIFNGIQKIGSATAKCNDNCEGCLCSTTVSFFVVDVDTQEPMINTPYFAIIDGKEITGKTDNHGYAFIKAKNGNTINIHFSFKTPTHFLNENGQ